MTAAGLERSSTPPGDHALIANMNAAFVYGVNRWRVNVVNNGTPADRLRGLRFYRALLTHEGRKHGLFTDGSNINNAEKARADMQEDWRKEPGAMPALPTDAYSVAYRQLNDHPEAVRSSSTITVADFFGRSETWVIESFWLEGAASVFVQRMAADGGFRLLLPPAVTAAIDSQRPSRALPAAVKQARAVLAGVMRKRKRARGEALGNPAALKKARAARADIKRKLLGVEAAQAAAAPKRRPGRRRKRAAPAAAAPRRGRPPGSKNKPKPAAPPEI